MDQGRRSRRRRRRKRRSRRKRRRRHVGTLRTERGSCSSRLERRFTLLRSWSDRSRRIEETKLLDVPASHVFLPSVSQSLKDNLCNNMADCASWMVHFPHTLGGAGPGRTPPRSPRCCSPQGLSPSGSPGQHIQHLYHFICHHCYQAVKYIVNNAGEWALAGNQGRHLTTCHLTIGPFYKCTLVFTILKRIERYY